MRTDVSTNVRADRKLEQAMVFVVFAAICVAPPLFVKLFMVAADHWSSSGGRATDFASIRVVPNANECSNTLRRLAAEHDRLLNSDAPVQAMRLRALSTAYDDALRHACRAVEVDPPPLPMDSVTRVQLEAELVVHGLNW